MCFPGNGYWESGISGPPCQQGDWWDPPIVSSPLGGAEAFLGGQRKGGERVKLGGRGWPGMVNQAWEEGGDGTEGAAKYYPPSST